MDIRDESVQSYFERTADLLRSVYSPTAQEAAILNANIALASSGAAQRDEEIARLEKALSVACSRRALLQASAQNAAALLAPVRRLPPEIVSLICSLSLPADWFDVCVTRRPPWNAAQICHVWREVCLSMSQCWATFTLERLPEIRNTDKAVDIVTTHLRRSAKLPLVVKIWTPVDVEHGVTMHLKLPDILEALKPAAHRIRVLQLRCSSEEKLPDSMPQVEEMVLARFVGDNFIAPMPIPEDATKLQRLELVDWCPSNIIWSWKSLRCLSVTHVGLDFKHTLWVLSQPINLESLTVAIHDPDVEEWELDEDFAGLPVVTVPSLRSLTARDNGIYFCRWLRAPHLETFELDVVYRDYEDDEDSERIISERDVQCLRPLLLPITTLKLVNVESQDHSDVMQKLVAAPQRLRSLHLCQTVDATSMGPLYLTSPIFHRPLLCYLAGDPTQPVLPDLEELVLDTSSLALDWDQHHAMLNPVDSSLIHRAVGSRLGAGKLRTLVLDCPTFAFPTDFVRWMDELKEQGTLAVRFRTSPAQRQIAKSVEHMMS
ncbi:hypothetical protein HDZ31DRAFT_63218 [Schizophyllum fasciatum]